MSTTGEHVRVETHGCRWDGEEKNVNGGNDDGCSVDFVDLFLRFLRIRTESFNGPKSGSYAEAVSFLSSFATRHLGFSANDVQVVENVKAKPNLLLTWRGSDQTLPSILLNSHYDVVPAMENEWRVDPWAGHIETIAETDDRLIVARGTQDMKCVCIQYLAAVFNLKRAGFCPLRNVVLMFVPDEEIGGADGMGTMIPHIKAMQPPVGIALDEGLACPEENTATVFYGERTCWWLTVTARGPTGHGSRFIASTAVEKLLGVANKAFTFRRAEEAKLGYPSSSTGASGCKHCEAKKLGDVTTINLTMLEAGVTSDGGKTFALNVIPTQARAGFDMRVTPKAELEDVKKMLDEWCAEEGLSWEMAPWTKPLMEHYTTQLDGSTWWDLFEEAVGGQCGIRVRKEVFPAATDSRFLRQAGIKAFGFSPLCGEEILLHEHNESIKVSTFLKGIGVYEKVIRSFASAQRHEDDDDNS